MSARVPDASAAGPLRAALQRSNYNAGGLMVALGGRAETSPGDAPLQSRRLGDSDQSVLARLFLLGEEVAAERAGEALAPAVLDDLVVAGFLEEAGEGGVRSPIRFSPFEGVLLAHDPEPLVEPDADIVTGLNSAARTLASLTPRSEVGRALDVGTGCGIQALLTARHARRVVATDVNARALAFTDLGAALNGFDNVETREGSFFDPVADEEYDLVVSNPPYVISPFARFTYRDGGLERDEVSRLALTGAASHLAPGGHAALLVNWVIEPFGHWSETLRHWLEGSGCDAVLLHHLSEDGLEYAAKWNAGMRRDPPALGRALDAWTDWYAEAGIVSLGTGAVALRRTAGEPRVSTFEMATGPAGRAGEHVLRLLAAADALAAMDDEQLLATPLDLVSPHSLVRERRHGDEGYTVEKVSLRLEHNAGLATEFGPLVGALIVGLDGERTVGDLLERMGSALGTDPANAREPVLAAVRDLLGQGFVELAEPVSRQLSWV